MDIRYLTVDQVVGFYIKIARSWNQPIQPILSRSAIESALTRPQNAANFENADLIRQSAYLLEGLVKAHGFLDGNKRVAFLATFTFLELNGYTIPPLPDNEMAEFVLSIAKNEIELGEIEKWLRDRVVSV